MKPKKNNYKPVHFFFFISMKKEKVEPKNLYPLLGERRGRIEHVKLEILKQLTATSTHMDSHVSPKLNGSLCKV